MGGDGVPQAKALWPGTRGCRSQSREQGRRKRGVWSGRQDWGAAPSDTHPPPLSVITAPSKMQSSSPVPLPVWVWSGVMVGQFSGKSPEQEESVSKADGACRVSGRDEGEL